MIVADQTREIPDAPHIPFYQYKTLSQMFALDFLVHLEAVDTENYFKKVRLDKLVVQYYDQNETIDSWESFVASRKQMWIKMLQSNTDTPATTWTFRQLAALISESLGCKVDLTEDLAYKFLHFVSTLLANYNDILNDEALQTHLHKIQLILEAKTFSKKPVKPTVNQVDQISNSIIRLSNAFAMVPLRASSVDNLKQTFVNLDQILSNTFSDVQNELLMSIDYLLNVKDQSDLDKCSRWFREMGSIQERQKLALVGFEEYKKNEEKIDSPVIANYIKHKLREIPLGLIPESIQSIIIELVHQQYLKEEEIKAISGLLGVSKVRYQILGQIALLCRHILKNGTVGQLTPSSIASIVSVTVEMKMDQIDMKLIHSKLDLWHLCWGKIIANKDLFFN